MANTDVTRREVLTKAADMAPAIVTLPVLLSFASAGSGSPGDYGSDPGDPGDYGDDGQHKRWKRGKHHSWERGKHYGWEKAPGQLFTPQVGGLPCGDQADGTEPALDQERKGGGS